jgi:hypothetical protein
VITFTLCSNNYVPKATVLAHSFLEHNPDSRFVLVVVDRANPSIQYPKGPNLSTIFIEQLQIPEFERMASSYSTIELNTAMKPFVFGALTDRGLDQSEIICYLDPDIRVYQPFAAIAEALNHAPIAVTPHILSPIPLDGRWPAENAFLNYGIYNLGFLALRAGHQSRALIEWWSSRLSRLCYDDVKNGLFVDQLWINYAPIYFNVQILRDYGLNVAYWNLHERRLLRKHNQWIVNDSSPLVFYHFSSFSLAESDAIGRPSHTRYSLIDLPDMRPLFHEYRTELIEAGAKHASSVPCSFRPVPEKLALSRRIRQKLIRMIASPTGTRPNRG